MTREAYHRELDKIELDLMRQAALVLQNMANAIQALIQGSSDFAYEVIASSTTVKTMQLGIQERCAVTIALQAPTATDLRRLLVMTRIGGQLEQIGQHAVNMAWEGIRLNQHTQAFMPQQMDLLAQEVLEWTHASIQTFVERNIQQARDLMANEVALEVLCWDAIQELRDSLEYAPDTRSATIGFLLAANELKNIRGHVITICEQVIYLVSGEVPALA